MTLGEICLNRMPRYFALPLPSGLKTPFLKAQLWVKKTEIPTYLWAIVPTYPLANVCENILEIHHTTLHTLLSG